MKLKEHFRTKAHKQSIKHFAYKKSTHLNNNCFTFRSRSINYSIQYNFFLPKVNFFPEPVDCLQKSVDTSE